MAWFDKALEIRILSDMPIISAPPEAPPTFPIFVRAVWSHWEVLMSGGAITVLLGAFEKLSGISIPYSVYIGVLILFIFIACFLAWRDERNNRFSTEGVMTKAEDDLEHSQEMVRTLNRELSEEKSKHTPNIIGKVRWFSCGVGILNKKEYTATTFLIEIRNLGMSSAITDWHLIVKLVGHEPFAVMPSHFGDELSLGREGLPSEVITNKDRIDNKTIEPVQTGAVVRGYLFFLFVPGRDIVDKPGTIIEIRFADVTSKHYSIVENRFPVQGSNYQIPPIPGVEIKKEPIKQKRGSQKRNNSK